MLLRHFLTIWIPVYHSRTIFTYNVYVRLPKSMFVRQKVEKKNKTNQLVSKNSHPRLAANKKDSCSRWGTKSTGTLYNVDKLYSGSPDVHFGKLFRRMSRMILTPLPNIILIFAKIIRGSSFLCLILAGFQSDVNIWFTFALKFRNLVYLCV